MLYFQEGAAAGEAPLCSKLLSPCDGHRCLKCLQKFQKICLWRENLSAGRLELDDLKVSSTQTILWFCELQEAP